MASNKNLHSKTELTEFARDFEESKDNNVLSKLVNRIYETCNTTSVYQISEESPSPTSPTTSVAPSSSKPLDIPTSPTKPKPYIQASHQQPSISEYKVDTSLGRTPSNVIKRISNLIAFRDSNLEDYKDTDFQKLWMPDSKSRVCYDCEAKFNTFRRKHHCRLCGQIFCNKCCNQNISGKILNVTGELRVCNYCSKVILTYLKSSDITADLKSDLQSLEENLSTKLNVTSSSPLVAVSTEISESPSRRKVSIGYQEERLISNPNSKLSNADRRNILQQSNTLKTLFEDMGKKLKNQVKGMDIVNFLINYQKCSTKSQAIEVISAMLEAGFIVPMYNEMYLADPTATEHENQISFNENFIYRMENVDLVPVSTKNFDETEESEMDNNSSDLSNFFPKEGNEKELQSSIFSTTAAKPFLEAYCDHEEQLLVQLLKKENLELSWSKTLINLCARIAHTIQPNVDSMDIRHYVKVKKISGGSRSECKIVNGITFSKNVVHKDMKTCIDNARVLLIQCPISYQRIEGKLVSVETLILQEKEYLRNVVSRILSYTPDIVLVHKNVSGLAQDMLRDSGITLVLDVKLSIFEKLSHCLECDIVTSIDSNIGKPKLGICKRFYTKNFTDLNGCLKTLMIFDIPITQRGCSLILRGGTDMELIKVKRVANFLLFSRYNFRLELCYLLDVFAQPAIKDPQILQSPTAAASSSPKDESKSLVNIAVKEKQSKENLMKKTALENIADFSDPLRRTEVTDEDTNLTISVQDFVENSFRANLSTSILSISPFVAYPIPYLETESGSNCYLRRFFPTELFLSHQTSKSNEIIHNEIHRSLSKNCEKNENVEERHEFLTLKITQPVDNKDIQTLIADFRRQNGKFPKVRVMKKLTKPNENETQSEDLCSSSKNQSRDAFDIYCHQRLPVLFCSFYYDTNHFPTSFCAEPLVLFMNFYGQDDIMLGLFLERYCFRSSYICSSCKLPMINHVRKYAHSMGVVTVKITEDQIKNESPNIKMTSRCKICNTMTPKVDMTSDTWCYSFAKFLELKFHGHSYVRNIKSQTLKSSCKHSIHRDHIQYFSSNGLVVTFTYTSADIFEVKFPSFVIDLKAPELPEKKLLEEKFKSFSIKGYEVYAKIHEKLANLSTEIESPMIASLKKVLHKSQIFFKRRVEVVYTLLSSYSNDLSSYEINDAILLAQKELADSIDLWGPKLNEAEIQMKLSQKNELQSQQFEVFDENLEDLDFHDIEGSSKSPEDNQSDKKEKIDKTTIKKLLSSLLPSNSDQNSLPSPFSPNEHFLMTGQFPILVDDNDPSSVIAYALMSHDYKKKIDSLFNSEPSASEISNISNNNLLKKSSSRDGKSEIDEKDTTDSNKKKISNSHVEVSVQDANAQFFCRIYFARQFDEIRSKCLNSTKPGNPENSPSFSRKCDEIRQLFARSLSQSKKWEARGGKSGSKFCKTIDDHFILKEMSKHDISEFEKFSTNYFDYIDSCVQNNHLTLLAKIFGVFKVVIKKKDTVIERSFLVIENLFCHHKIKSKYDLKGSERNRLVQANNDSNEETVLLDENFIKASWNKPLYILSHSQTLLKDVIHRDASFLEKNQVMDYSLLVGVDESFLIVGIIDYIRKFTIDKRIESYIKQVVDQRLPTVINPNMYKNRFMDAMNRYFLLIPDRWQGLSNDSHN